MPAEDVAIRTEDLLSAFDARTLAPDAFSHREHVRVAWILLRRHPLPEAAARFCAGLRAIATAAGKPERYHETVTWAYLLLINDRIARQDGDTQGGGTQGYGPSPDFEAPDDDAAWSRFAGANADMLTDGRALLAAWYDPATLESALARRTFIWPDRRTSR